LVNRYALVCQGAPKDYSITWKPTGSTPLAFLFLPCFVGAVVLLSILTNHLSQLVGYDGAYDYGDSVLLCLFTSALLPAILEELFCRYIFLPRLTVYSRSGAILASALFFAFLHGNFVQIPYALFAGLFLGTLAVVCKSVFPCIIFHFINNAASILLHFYKDTILPDVLFYVLIALLLFCGVLIWCYRKKIFALLRNAMAKDEEEPQKAGVVVGKLFLSPLVAFFILFLIEACLRF
jgi:membrane protease YdiL (CAAX protease family)